MDVARGFARSNPHGRSTVLPSKWPRSRDGLRLRGGKSGGEGRDGPSPLIVIERWARQRRGINPAAVIPDCVNHMLRRVCPDLRVVPVLVGSRMGGARICAPLGEERRFATRPVLLARLVVIGARRHPFAQFLQMGKIRLGSRWALSGLGQEKSRVGSANLAARTLALVLFGNTIL